MNMTHDNAEVRCPLWCVPEQAVEHTIELSVALMWRHCNVLKLDVIHKYKDRDELETDGVTLSSWEDYR